MSRLAPQTAVDINQRYKALLAITESISSHANINDLFKELPKQLRPVVDFDAVAVLLYEPSSDAMRLHVFETIGHHPVEPIIGKLLGVDDSVEGLSWKTQQPILISPVSTETRFPNYIRRLKSEEIETLYSIPLTSCDRQLGAIAFGSRRADAYGDDDLEFLGQVAKQVAVAVDNVLNLDAASSERDRFQLLLQTNNALVANLELGELLRTVFDIVQKAFKNDAASLSLYDEAKNVFRMHTNDLRWVSTIEEGIEFPPEGTPAGRVLETRKPFRADSLSLEEFPSPMLAWGYAEGLRSGCSIPLIAHDKFLGVLEIGSLRENAFSEADVLLLNSIAQQVSIAVENTLNFNQAVVERERAELVLEASNAIVSNLDLRELLKATSASIKKYLKHDFFGLSLYDKEIDTLRVYAIDCLPDGRFIAEGAPLDLATSAGGRAFTTRKTVVVRYFDVNENSSETARMAVASGLRIWCSIPLISRGVALGVIAVASKQDDAFKPESIEILEHIANEVAIAVENVLQYREITSLKNKLASEKTYLEEEIKTEYNFAEIVGRSPALKRVLKQVETVAPTDSVVMIYGETGTGKELIARSIHNLSQRSERTLVKLNCAAIPTGLIESELFGHEKGAFTGAVAQRVGRFELAHKGTLFLDEVGEIPLDLQPKLLRVLQELEFERLGSSRTFKVDTRLIAATNCDLKRMGEDKQFRSDLYYRLNVFPIVVPPLRERPEDISLLASYFTQKHSARMNRRIETIPTDTMSALTGYSWPGNVRELENFIERSVILSSGTELQAPLAELGPQTSKSVSTAGLTKLASMEQMERGYIEDVLRHTGGAIAGKGGAAEILGLPASTLRNRMKKLGLK